MIIGPVSHGAQGKFSSITPVLGICLKDQDLAEVPQGMPNTFLQLRATAVEAARTL